MDIKKLEKILLDNNQPKFRLGQIKKAIYQDGISSFLEISNLPKNLREILNDEVKILPFETEKVLDSKDKNSFKALLKLEDGNLLESVLISPKSGMWSVCVSTQVGCALNCKFCATGKNGFKRNLSTEEIVGQVLFWEQTLKKKNEKVSNVVYMGMGEPFLNWEATKESLETLNDPTTFNLGARGLSVSTSGVTEGILNLAKDFPQVNLALSLHFADDEKRSQYMPINKKHNLEELKETLQKYFELSNRKVFLEYIMLDGVNDSLEDAQKLVDYIKSIGKLQLLHVNLIRYNSTDANLAPSSGNQTQKFKNFLDNNRIQVTIRKSLGEEIQGACGQLAGK